MSITTSQGRIYDIDGKQLPSVTTILGILQKPALVPWAAKMTAEYIQGIISQNDDLNALDWDVILKDAKGAHRAKSKDAMAHGTRVHEAVAYWIDQQGTVPRAEVATYLETHFTGTDEEIEAAMAGFDSFLVWADSVDLEIIDSEKVVSDNEYYAGRYDLLAMIHGVKVLIDIKTSTGIWDEYWLQLAGYASALEDLPDAVGVLRIDKVTGGIEYVQRLQYHHEIAAFQSLAIAYNHIQALKPAPKPRKGKASC